MKPVRFHQHGGPEVFRYVDALDRLDLSTGELLEGARWFFDGTLKPVIDRTFPLAEAAAAQRYLEDSTQFEKIVSEV